MWWRRRFIARGQSGHDPEPRKERGEEEERGEREPSAAAERPKGEMETKWLII